MPTNATRSFVRTVTGKRATVRTSGSSIRSPPLGGDPRPQLLGQSSDFQLGRAADEVRDQPLPVDPRDIESPAVTDTTTPVLASTKWHSKCSVPRSPLTVISSLYAG